MINFENVITSYVFLNFNEINNFNNNTKNDGTTCSIKQD